MNSPLPSVDPFRLAFRQLEELRMTLSALETNLKEIQFKTTILRTTIEMAEWKNQRGYE